MARLEGKIAFITGAGRGQGRAHAIRFAEEGADIIAVDICEQISTVKYPLATAEELAQTAKEVEGLGRRIVTAKADVRDRDALKAAFDDGVSQLGGIDIVVANAGIAPVSLQDGGPDAWKDVIDVNLTGVWNTIQATYPTLVEQGRGGSIVLTSSVAGLSGLGGGNAGGDGYTAAKHGLVGLMRNYAKFLAPHSIRVNTVHPSGVNTPMIVNEAMMEILMQHPDALNAQPNALPVQMAEPVDISNAILWLVSDEARYVTGVTLPVDAGYLLK